MRFHFLQPGNSWDFPNVIISNARKKGLVVNSVFFLNKLFGWVSRGHEKVQLNSKLPSKMLSN